jgi:hypothetical protein
MKTINQIVSVGSVDGICTVAALLRYIGGSVDLEFCQAFTVDRVDPYTWDSHRRVALVDLAVNNRDPAMTSDFVRRIRNAGHEIVAIIDEHNREDWLECLGSFQGLFICPVSQDIGKIKSSGALLSYTYGEEMDDHGRALCDAADAGDRMDFTTRFGGMVNHAVKSRIADDSRRVYLARHFAANADPDATIEGWIAEYEKILLSHDAIVDSRVDLEDGIVRVSAVGATVDMTVLMKRLYTDYRLVLLEGELFDKKVGAKVRQIAFGCKPGLDLDLVAILKSAGIECSGFAAKANVPLEYEDIALQAVRSELRNL